jgi:hypothetical protein
MVYFQSQIGKTEGFIFEYTRRVFENGRLTTIIVYYYHRILYMILVIRGHIRNSSKSKQLYEFVEVIHELFPEVQIFIHTWNIFANNISWRSINQNNTIVSKDIIYDYFSEVKHLIDNIIIDDDKNIKIIGNIEGNINKSNSPLIGWKNYWYGKYTMIKHIYDKNINEDEMIINLRFDILNNSNNFDTCHIINFIKNNIGKSFTKNIFIKDIECFGIDNIYIGNINTMYKLANFFYYYLDDILDKNNDTIHQEFLVYRINNSLFD